MSSGKPVRPRKTTPMLRSRQDEVILTGDRALDYMLCTLGGFQRADLEAMVRVVRDAMVATDRRGDPDHSIRLRASELAGTWVGLRGGRDRDSAAQDRVAAVQINLNVAAQRTDPEPGLQAGRLEIHLAGNGHAPVVPEPGAPPPTD